MMEIKDSGNRRVFDSGACRDIDEGKGRCDLLALDCVADYFFEIARPERNPDYKRARICGELLYNLNLVLWNKEIIIVSKTLLATIDMFIQIVFEEKSGYAFMELAKHYEQGAKKYAERNWQKGIPCHCYIDSCVRHLLKWYDGWNDEPHDRAVLWNLFGLMWTLKNKPEMNDLPWEVADNETEGKS